MMEQEPNYRGEFFKSPHHVWLGVLTLGLGFASGTWIGLLLGAGVYGLGWVYLPDMGFFRRRVDQRLAAQKAAEEQARLAGFIRQRDKLLDELTASRRDQYSQLTQVCRDIDLASADNPLIAQNGEGDLRMRKIEELMWTYLRLLRVEQSLAEFLEVERRERVPESLREAESEAKALTTEVESLRRAGNNTAAESKQRLVESKLERLEALRKRMERIEQTRSNHALAVAEQERLAEEIKLIRAEAVATKNSSGLSARIDATVEHLAHTNRWISELDEFKDMVSGFPSGDLRVGFDRGMPPVVDTRRGATDRQVNSGKNRT
jgi:hypothetical protein